MRFCKELVAHKLDRLLFMAVTAQLKSKAVTVKTGTLVNATIIASASEDDDDARWGKHKGKPAVHGFKAHVGADADTALVEEVSVTSANINDGRAGPEVLPDNPGEVFADSACRGNHCRDGSACKGRHTADRRHRHAGLDREDLRYMEALLRLAPNAMARSRQSRRPGSPHRHRLQPQARHDHSRGPGVKGVTALTRAATV